MVLCHLRTNKRKKVHLLLLRRKDVQGQDDRRCRCSEEIDAPLGETDVRDARIGDDVLCMSAAPDDVHLLKDHGMDAEHTRIMHLLHTAQHVLRSEAF